MAKDDLTDQEREAARAQGRRAPNMSREGLRALARVVDRARNEKGRREAGTDS